MKRNPNLFINRNTILAAASASIFLAFSLYLLFLEPAHMISRLRLAVAGVIGMAIFFAILAMLGFDLFKLNKLRPRILTMGFMISLIFSAVVLTGGFGLANMRYSLLLLAKHNVVIQPQCPAGSGVVELKFFKNGLDVVSYDAFEKQGLWERTSDSLRTKDCSQARLTYHGWLVETPVLAFRTQPGGGAVTIQWGGVTVTQELSSSSSDQVEISRDMGPDLVNKAISLFIFLIALSFLLFPLASQFSAGIIDPINHHNLKDWFEETAANLQPLVLVMLTLSLLASVGLFISPWLEMDHTPVTPSDPTVQEKPNIILIIADSMTAQDMSLFGYHLPTTPNLEKVTRDWTIYTNANTASTCTIAVYPALDSGRYPIYSYPFSQYGKKISKDPDWVNLIAMMSQAGYTTYYNNYYIQPSLYHLTQGIDNFLFYSTNNPLFYSWLQMNIFQQTNFPHYPFLLQLASPLFHQNSRFVDSPEILGNMFKHNEFKAPFFIYMHYRGPHFGSYYAGKYLGTFLPKSEGMTGYYEQNELLGAYSPDKQPLLDKLRLRYDEAILHEDNAISQLIDQIKAAGVYDSSMIIVTADHGQVFDNGFSSHCTPLISYNETHIPILIKFPNQTEGRKVDSLISLVDLTPTILDTAKIQYQPEWFDGISLLTTRQNSGNHDLIYIRSVNDNNNQNTISYAVMDNQYKMTKRYNGYFLFDYRQDAKEKRNLMNDPTMDANLVAALKNALDEFILKTKTSN